MYMKIFKKGMKFDFIEKIVDTLRYLKVVFILN